MTPKYQRQGQEAAGSIMSTVKKQRQVNAGAQLAGSLLSPGPQLREWC